MKQLAILGAGSWGTALAIALASRFSGVRVWAREPAFAEEVRRIGQNARYLPGFRLPPNVLFASDASEVVKGAEIVLAAVPSTYLRSVLEATAPHIQGDVRVVSATKGIEERSLCRMSEVIDQVLGGRLKHGVSVLSGPTFAKEIAAGEPAAVVVACEHAKAAECIQSDFSTGMLRLYASGDVIGVETGAALKNVIAIGAGVCRGLGLGSNSVAALVTRGLAEITRLAVKLGAEARTLSGLAGLGDLVLTATGDLSRNRFVGIGLGQGRRLQHILGEMKMVAEGVTTCRAAYQLGLAHQIELPIVSKMYEILYEEKEPRQAIRELMERRLTSE